MRQGILGLGAITVALASTFGCGGSIEASNDPPTANTDGGGGVGGSSGSGSGSGSGGGGSGSGGAVAQGGTGGTNVTGVGCDLNVVAALGLPQPAYAVAHVTGPAIAATDTGFVIAFREQSPVDGLLMLRVLHLDDFGTLVEPARFVLWGCGNQTPDDGVGAVYRSGTGLIATSLPNCDPSKGAGAVFLPFDTNAAVSDVAGPQNPAFLDIHFAQAGSVAAGVTPGEFEVMYRRVSDQTAIERVVLQGSEFKSGVPILTPFGETNVPYGAITTSEQIRVLVAPKPGGVTAHVGSLGSDPAVDVPSTLDFEGESQFTALTAWDNRFAIANPTAGGLKLSIAHLDSGAASTIGSTILGAAKVQSGALTTLGTNLFVGSGNPDAFNLHRLDTTAPSEPLVPNLSTSVPKALVQGFDGKHMAMAAARQRVAVVWLNRPELVPTDGAGGWALLECNP
jgi:hypothetical protein